MRKPFSHEFRKGAHLYTCRNDSTANSTWKCISGIQRTSSFGPHQRLALAPGLLYHPFALEVCDNAGRERSERVVELCARRSESSNCDDPVELVQDVGALVGSSALLDDDARCQRARFGLAAALDLDAVVFDRDQMSGSNWQ